MSNKLTAGLKSWGKFCLFALSADLAATPIQPDDAMFWRRIGLIIVTGLVKGSLTYFATEN